MSDRFHVAQRSSGAGTSTSYSNRFHDSQVAGSLRSARRVVPLLAQRLGPQSVLDVGCGRGAWLVAWLESGVDDVLGVDGDYIDRSQLLIDRARFVGHDLRAPLALGRTFDVVQSLEVAEHLPATAVDDYLTTLVSHAAQYVVFSAAIPGQGGTGHVNEQWPSYWVQKLAERGFAPLGDLRPSIWNDRDIEPWYRQNLLVFGPSSGDGAAGQPGLIDVVHPELWEHVAVPTRSQRLLAGVRRLALRSRLERLDRQRRSPHGG